MVVNPVQSGASRPAIAVVVVGLLALLPIAACDIGDPNAPVYHGPNDSRGTSTGGIVAGKVVGPGGDPVEGAGVSFDRTDGMPHGGTGIWTLEDGTFEVGVKPTRYALTVRAEGFVDYHVEIDVQAGQRYDIEIDLEES